MPTDFPTSLLTLIADLLANAQDELREDTTVWNELIDPENQVLIQNSIITTDPEDGSLTIITPHNDRFILTLFPSHPIDR